MNKWWCLLLLVLFWMAAGFVVFGAQPVENHRQSRPSGGICRIVSMAPNLTEIVFALGLDEQIVAVSNDSDWPAQAHTKNRTGTFWQPNIEAVIAARPDLVLTLAITRQTDLAERLTRMGYNTLSPKIEKVGDLFEAIEEIGKATGREVQAKTLAADIRKKLDDLSARVGGPGRVKVLYVVQREPLRVAGRDTFINEMLDLAGGENAIGRTLHKYPPIGAEQVIACGAEVIIEPVMGDENLADQQEQAVRFWSRFKNVPAVKHGRVHVIDGDIVSRLGPRLYEGTRTIARCLRPELIVN
ncbi:MAG: ABC transporter substrate-binding protein [Planctomycetota bacterium]|jgi:iron complex transport system substrate-binding protein